MKDIDVEVPQDPDEFNNLIKRVLSANDSDCQPPYSAFWKNSRVELVPLPGFNSRDALEWLGHQYQLFRGMGREGINGARNIGGAQVHRDQTFRFHADYQWFLDFRSLVLDGRTDGVQFDGVAGQIGRSEFGLPLSYFKKKDGVKYKLELKPNPEKNNAHLDRRASPILFHIHVFPDQSVAAVLTHFSDLFLPADVQLAKVSGDHSYGQNGNQVKHAVGGTAPLPQTYSHIPEFMDAVLDAAPGKRTR